MNMLKKNFLDREKLKTFKFNTISYIKDGMNNNLKLII